MKKIILYISVAVISLGIIGLAAVTAVSSLSPKGAIEQELSQTKKMLRQGFDRNKELVNENEALSEKNINHLQQIDEKNRELDSLRKQLQGLMNQIKEREAAIPVEFQKEINDLEKVIKEKDVQIAELEKKIKEPAASSPKISLPVATPLPSSNGPVPLKDISDEEVGKLRRQIAKEYLGTIEDLLAYIDRLKAGSETASEIASSLDDSEPSRARHSEPAAASMAAEESRDPSAASQSQDDAPPEDIHKLQTQLEEEKRLRKKDRATFYYNLGVVYSQYNLYSEASEVLKKAILLDPEDAASHYNLAILYDDHLDKKDKAVEHYEAYLKLAPDTKKRMEVENWIQHAKKLAPRHGGRGRSARGAMEHMFLTHAEGL